MNQSQIISISLKRDARLRSQQCEGEKSYAKVGEAEKVGPKRDRSLIHELMGEIQTSSGNIFIDLLKSRRKTPVNSMATQKFISQVVLFGEWTNFSSGLPVPVLMHPLFPIGPI